MVAECLAESGWAESLRQETSGRRDTRLRDEEIITLYQERSEMAIWETKTKYGGYLNQVAYNILRNAEDTEEIVNDTYMGAWNSIPPTIPNSLKFFLARITRNLSLDRMDYKMAGKRNAICVELDETLPDGGETPEQTLEHKELGRIINAFLGTLDKQTCALFVARYFHFLTMEEVARQYGTSQRHAKYVLMKTRKKLKAWLEKEGITA